MGLAFQWACEEPGLPHAEDGTTEMVASKIILLAHQGENDPDWMCRRVLREFNIEA